MQIAYAKYYNSVTNFPENTEGVSLGKKIDKIVQVKPMPAASRTMPVYSMQDSESIYLTNLSKPRQRLTLKYKNHKQAMNEYSDNVWH